MEPFLGVIDTLISFLFGTGKYESYGKNQSQDFNRNLKKIHFISQTQHVLQKNPPKSIWERKSYSLKKIQKLYLG